MARLELEVGTDVLLLETGDALLLEHLSVSFISLNLRSGRDLEMTLQARIQGGG